jgi:hypothetical protein
MSKNEWQKTKTIKIDIFYSQINYQSDIRHSRHSNIVKIVHFTVRHSDIFYFIFLLILLFLHRHISYDFTDCRTSSIHHAHLSESISRRWRLWLNQLFDYHSISSTHIIYFHLISTLFSRIKSTTWWKDSLFIRTLRWDEKEWCA